MFCGQSLKYYHLDWGPWALTRGFHQGNHNCPNAIVATFFSVETRNYGKSSPTTVTLSNFSIISKYELPVIGFFFFVCVWKTKKGPLTFVHDKMHAKYLTCWLSPTCWTEACGCLIPWNHAHLAPSPCVVIFWQTVHLSIVITTAVMEWYSRTWMYHVYMFFVSWVSYGFCTMFELVYNNFNGPVY
jgi:hypothetical protein